MANITFHVDTEVHARMKKHPEIKWSEIFRRSITEYLAKLETSEMMSSRDLWSRLDDDTRKIINKLGENLDIEKEARTLEKLHDVESARVADRWKAEQERE
jgi:hypothetical protein